ncbi:hypothetical protein [Amycolatopsis sp. CA-126428]|uniref:hypothetical protein n=1 Tax=Amycolatopsis sp. CA-126428 TaxID=2073158 RepID=UPI0011B05536|nr:hypothetical protein [Amycolatopsis sp. CA-126428]
MSAHFRRLLSTAALAALPLAGIAVAGPATASATSLNPCAHPGWREDQPTYGHLTGDPTNIRSGPYLDCAINKVGARGAAATYMCWVDGGDVQGTPTWTFVYSSGSRGWVNDSLLEHRGSPYHC